LIQFGTWSNRVGTNGDGVAGAPEATTIVCNILDGIEVLNAGTIGNSLRGNAINDNGGLGIDFATVIATSLTVNSDTRITMISPPHVAGVVDVTVTTPNGTSTTSNADLLTFFAPTVTCLPSTQVAAGLAPGNHL